jgi:hypothetical protein
MTSQADSVHGGCVREPSNWKYLQRSTDPVATDEIKQRTRSQGMLCTYCDVPELPQQPTGRERLLTQAN